MSRSSLLLTLFLLFSCEIASGQITPKIADIKRSPQRFLNEIVTVEGFVTQFVEAGTQTTRFYYLKDDWGGIIRVRTSAEKPEVGRRYRVVGPVSVDPGAEETFISEERRSALDQPAATREAIPVPSAIPPPKAESNDSIRTVLIAGVVLVFGLLAALLFYVLQRRGRAGDQAVFPGELPFEAPPTGGETIEGKTIKIQLPPPGTLKLLPGRLEVLSGDETVREIRFHRPKGRVTSEITFGRASGPAYTHVQLKPMTVSSRQAKLMFTGDKVQLINYPSPDSNPTRVNDRELGVEESVVLQSGDRISMGEVEFRYHAQ